MTSTGHQAPSRARAGARTDPQTDPHAGALTGAVTGAVTDAVTDAVSDAVTDALTDALTDAVSEPAGLRAEEPRLDGRAARGRRTREAVIEALLALQEEGDLTPTASRVAARAGVALRTVYGHFADMEALWLEAGRRELQKISALADVPPADAPRSERVQRFCASRARVLEALMPVMRAARLRMPCSPQLTRNWATFVEVGAAEVREVFATELADLPEEDADRLVAGVYLASSAPAWEVLRLDLHLDTEACEAVVRNSVTALLTLRDNVPPQRDHRPGRTP